MNTFPNLNHLSNTHIAAKGIPCEGNARLSGSNQLACLPDRGDSLLGRANGAELA